MDSSGNYFVGNTISGSYTVTTSSGFGWIHPDDEEGGASVREPRRPKPAAPAGAIELEHVNG